jgi:peroxiredoxin
MQMFGDPPSTANYIRAIDTIMKIFAVNEEFKNYALVLLINTFENTNWEKVYIHVVNSFVTNQSCSLEGAEEYVEKAETLKNLQAGNPAPPIVMNDINGKPQSLYDVKAKVTLLFFWGSECPHCHEILPSLSALYVQWQGKGLEIYAVSVDTDKDEWKKAVTEGAFPWINVCDLKGVDSDVFAKYNTWYTPGFYMLDENKKILSHPYLLVQIENQLRETLK